MLLALRKLVVGLASTIYEAQSGSQPSITISIDRFHFRENLIACATKRRGNMKTYRALVTLPNIGQTPVTVEARSTYEAKTKLEAMYGKGNVTNPYEV
jgi:hypothetical protein